MVREQIKARTIVRNPRILSGEPIVEGTRISVRTIVLARYMFGSAEHVQEQLPTLRVPDIEAALDYYQNHRDEINAYIAENNEGENIPDMEGKMVKAHTKARAIVSRPDVLSGEPTVAGTRVSVRTVVLTKYAFGDVETVHDELPTLSIEDIEAALQYYREHRDEINAYIAANTEGEEIPYERL